MRDPISIARRWLASLLLVCTALPLLAQDHVVYEGKQGPGKGKHVVLVSGDEEYRSEEALPMLGKILSQRHGFKCTVLFAVDPDGVINPNNNASLSHPEALDTADVIVTSLRWRRWPDEQMKHFVDAYLRGVPIVALRTSTHPFNYKGGDSPTYKSYNLFGKRVVGENWVNHWGDHKKQATKGIIEESAKNDPILRGVTDVFCDSDVYEVYPPADVKVLIRGQVLKGMTPDSPPAENKKRRSTDKQEQGVNDPMMPVAWSRTYKNEAGKENRVLATTMGAATDLQNEGLRRLVINGVYWGLGLDVPAKADVDYVGEYKPTMYGFNGYKKGTKPADYAMKTEQTSGAAPAVTPAPVTPVLAQVNAINVTDQSSGGPLVLKKDDHIAIIGNTLPDRMQHFGWLETLVHARYKDLNLVVRNLGFSGDEVVTRARSENFGSPDEWLTRVKADVILAFFGFNESFKGAEGLDKFKADLDKFLKDTKQKNYSGKGNPRIVLFSPVANERHKDPNIPDVSANNERIRLYAAAMAEVAKANDVQYVDLYAPTTRMYSEASQKGESLTVNGLHLTEKADKQLAPEIFRDLFGESAPDGDFEKLRTAVNDKNWEWHHRYRTVDGYNVYGGRSRLTFPQGKDGPKLSNYDVMQQEMAQRDVITANRDPMVWAYANGKYDYKVVDDNLPEVTKVITNKPGANPDGSHPYTDGEEAIKLMKPHAGIKVNLFADEKQFPQLINPVQMAWDTKGRLWVSVWRTYPERTPTDPIGDSILIFEDTNNDGRADKCSTFLGNLNCPTGFQFYKDGILLMQAPDLWWVRDTDGDGKADSRERMLSGMDSADSHHTTNAMCYDPGGAVYLSDGVFHRTQVETHTGPVRNIDAAIYRFEPMTTKFETYIAYGFANPHGRVFDYWGNDIITDATGNNSYYGPAFSGRIDYPTKHKALRQFWERPSRPCPHTNILTSRHFPDDWQGNFLNLNVIGFQGIYRVNMKMDGSGLTGTTLPDLITSTDPNFRPIFVNTGPDGALYMADWSQTIIGHMQHHIRDPNRDHEHGRIYRLTYEGRPLMKPAKIHGEPVMALLDLLKEPENQTRELAKIELGNRDSKEVIAKLRDWIEQLDKNDKNYEHHMTEALWVHQWHNVVDVELLKRMLKSPEFNARAAATRVLCYWRDRVPNTLAMLKEMANDAHPRVRLEAVRAASFFRDADAANVALAVLKHPTDYYLDYTLGETMKQLEQYWKPAIAQGKLDAVNDSAALKYLVSGFSVADLLKLPKTPAVLETILLRGDLPDATRSEALNGIATEKKTTRAVVLLDLIDSVGKSDTKAGADLARMLPQQPAGELKAVRARLDRIAGDSAPVALRPPVWGALILADNGIDQVWGKAQKYPELLRDMLNGIPTIFDADVRNLAYEKVAPLLAREFPKELLSDGKPTSNVRGRYVRIDLPRRGALSLAEVQVFANGKNVATEGKASQSTTANDGEASRAIDGRTEGRFSSGTVTHTAENGNNAWWEVDLGKEVPIESIVVWNRTDAQLGQRLERYVLTVLDGSKKEIFRKANNPAPQRDAKFAMTTDTAADLRRAAIAAAVSMTRDPAATFKALANLIAEGQQVTASARGLRAIPRNAWPKDVAGSVAKDLVAWAKQIPAAERTNQEYLETVQFATDLAGLLPAQDASDLRKELKELRVAVFVLTSVREQMRYDTPRLVVEAGKPFEIIFENTDFMPHNVVVVTPGSREKVGTMSSEMTPDQLDRQGRAFIPRTSEVLAGTKLLESGEKASLKMVAPEKEGDYDYVCTYPGHWELMWGRLVVTKDVDAYLAANPEPTPAKAAKPGATHDHH